MLLDRSEIQHLRANQEVITSMHVRFFVCVEEFDILKSKQLKTLFVQM